MEICPEKGLVAQNYKLDIQRACPHFVGTLGFTIENKFVRTTMRLSWIFWDILGQFGKDFLKSLEPKNVFLVISDNFLP